jgi:hypothetical protein
LGFLSIFLIPFYLTAVLKHPLPNDYYENRKKIIVEQVQPQYQQAALEDLRKREDASNRLLPVVIGLTMGVPLCLLEIIPMWFFTRPKVKEQFIQKGNI